jgi:hypothetical protein
MSFGHMGIPQLHNSKKCRKDGVPIEELKASIEVHFTNGAPHPTMLQAKDVPLQLGDWRGKVDLLVFTLGGMDCVLGMEFITHNNVLIEGHNRLIRIPSKNGVIWVKAHEVFNVSGSTIHLMLGKTFQKECMGGCGTLCVMHCWLNLSQRKLPTW